MNLCCLKIKEIDCMKATYNMRKEKVSDQCELRSITDVSNSDDNSSELEYQIDDYKY